MCDDPREAAKFLGVFRVETVNLSVKTQLKYQKYCFYKVRVLLLWWYNGFRFRFLSFDYEKDVCCSSIVAGNVGVVAGGNFACDDSC